MKRSSVLAVGVLGAAAVLVGGPFVYINFVADDAPAPLTVTTDPPAGTEAPGTTGAPGGTVDPAGVWKVGDGSAVGYRVNEVLFGQDKEAVGRTSEIEGSVTIGSGDVTEAEFTVGMASVTSDSDRRDGQFNGRIMDTAAHPTATFSLSSPLVIPADATSGEAFSVEATGTLTLRGETKPVTFTLTARLNGVTAEVSGAIPIVFADWGIPNPSFGPVTTEDSGRLEFLLMLRK